MGFVTEKVEEAAPRGTWILTQSARSFPIPTCGEDRIDIEQIRQKDAEDSLRDFRNQFSLPEGVYLDGNSLGCLPNATLPCIQKVVQTEWGADLITSWNKHHWIDLPQRIGAKLGRLLGADADEIVVVDSTSINVFKTVSAALDLRPDRHIIISERQNFPTDLYMLEGLIRSRGNHHKLVLLDDPRELADGQYDFSGVAAVLLTHVSYCSGRMLDMPAITSAIHKGGALVVWDLAHSAGAVPVHLNNANADFAIGCGYKYLNGGPGAPAFLYVARQHQAAAVNPLCGWFGHKNAFAFDHKYTPADGINRFLCGTPSVIAFSALEVGVDIMLSADQKALRQKSLKMGILFLQLISQECSSFGFTLFSPSCAEERGSQVNICHKEGYAIIQALIARGVIGDFRAPDILRFGFTPLYIGFEDIYDAVQHLRAVMENKEWDSDKFRNRSKVT